MFRLFALRFCFVSKGVIRFPPAVPANILRGALGWSLQRSDPAAYARIFAPHSENGPSGLRARPRPFVFRAAHLEGATITAGDEFFFELHLFDTRDAGSIASLTRAFEEMAAVGLGPERARAELVRVEPLADGDESEIRPMCMGLATGDDPVKKLRVRFVTPTELKAEHGLADRPDFRILACRARDRISALMSFYGDGAPDVDPSKFAEHTASVSMTRCEIRQVAAERRSSRSGEVHPLGGFTGLAEYEGEIAEFLPWLRVAQWTGVGRQTVWGKGEIAVSILR